MGLKIRAGRRLRGGKRRNANVERLVDYHRSGLLVFIQVVCNSLGTPYPRLVIEVPRAKHQKMT
jgi:hypothetical protein